MEDLWVKHAHVRPEVEDGIPVSGEPSRPSQLVPPGRLSAARPAKRQMAMEPTQPAPLMTGTVVAIERVLYPARVASW